jgi:hypothetical protein
MATHVEMSAEKRHDVEADVELLALCPRWTCGGPGARVRQGFALAR